MPATSVHPSPLYSRTFPDNITVMPAHISSQAPAVVRPRRVQLTSFMMLLLGAVVVPVALAVTFNGWGPLTEESAIRMAFATVAGQAVAVLSGLLVAAVAIRRRDGRAKVIVLVVVALMITTNAFAIITSAGDLLLSRLDLVAETDLLNR